MSKNRESMTTSVLITGSTGFVGRALMKNLLKLDVDVRVIVRKSNDVIPKNSKITSVICTDDIFSENQSWWDSVSRNIDYVFHLAWYVEPGKYLNSDKNMDCVLASLKFGKACGKNKVKKFIGIGTCFEYDTTRRYLSVNTDLKPETAYAASKVSTFYALSKYFELTKTEFLWCRLFYLFGENENKQRLVPYIKSQIIAEKIVELSSGTQIRDFMDVELAGREIVKTAFSKVVGPYNICSGEAVTVREIAEKIAKKYNRMNLLKFSVRDDNLTDPDCVVGIKGNALSN